MLLDSVEAVPPNTSSSSGRGSPFFSHFPLCVVAAGTWSGNVCAGGGAGPGGWGLWVGGVNKKKPSPRSSGRGPVQSEGVLVVQVAGWRRAVELAGGANRFFARIGHGESSRFIPVQMVDGIRVFGVGFGQFAGEDLCLLLEPCRTQSLDRRAGRCAGGARGNALRQRNLIRHVRPGL